MPIGAVPEQALIALMRLNVIDALGGCTTSANRVVPEIFGARFLPLIIIAACAGARALLIEACFTLTILLGLAGATHAMRDDLAA
ncbi:hypothetical protein [Phyllobacterium bourgognense]|uniref:hypothetical protein n=1 Tax=Phyllobacterium bourgognense TaxID=314236 RepID=UPI00315C885C